ncbi:MAG: LON peptidase substrate-binding domain-containing protein [Planctomycetota bacterium]|nr:LON peptidase substrate-binding domain-containing protein [Planctomycetota bacterium]
MFDDDDAGEGFTIEVDFGRPIPLFPLDGVVLLPMALLKLYIFEPRYRNMVRDVIESDGVFAMAVFEGDRWKQEYHGAPPIRRSVCVAKIVKHQSLPGGDWHVIVQGVCRARVVQELSADADRLYRAAVLAPLESGRHDEDELCVVRDGLLSTLGTAPLTDLVSVRSVLRELESREIPTDALMEVVTLGVLSDKKVQYRLLAEGNIFRRSEIVEQELGRLRRVMARASLQWDPDAPSGVTWN